MVTTQHDALLSSSSEDAKRKRIREYFKKPRLKWGLISMLVGFLMLSNSSWMVLSLGYVLLLAGGAWLYFEFKPVWSGPGDQMIDAWLAEDIEKLQQRSKDRLGIDKAEELIQNSVVIVGPILWSTHGIAAEDLLWKKGKDNQTRFSVNKVTIVHLTRHKLCAYQCDHNFIKGVPLNERDDEFHYRDVVAVSTRDASTNFSLPNGALMKHAQMFKLAVSSGDTIEVVVGSSDLLEFTGGTIKDSGIDEAIKALRKVLGEKKI
jgi:hypothetical protein